MFLRVAAVFFFFPLIRLLPISTLFPYTTLFRSLLSKALDHAALRQAVHTANIANAGTENFSRLEVIFDSQPALAETADLRSEEHTSELQSQSNLVCRLLLEKKKHASARALLRQS